MKITFWGVRGSKPRPGKDTLVFGGNTSCIQVDIGDQLIILDGGTGIVELGRKLSLQKDNIDGKIFLSHYHWDHIQGLPFFKPFNKEGNRFEIYGEDKYGQTLEEILKKQMTKPFFPIGMDDMEGDLVYKSIQPNEKIHINDDIKIETFRLNHPDHTLAFKITSGDRNIVYSTDTENNLSKDELAYLDFIKNADVLIIDTNYTDDEYRGKVDGISKETWGHGTFEEGTRLAKKANVDFLVLFHHSEDRNDRDQAIIEKRAQALFKNSIAAREGMTIDLGGGKAEKVVINYPS